MTDKASPKSFEKSLESLSGIVDKMESGDLTLEQSLKQFEQGVKLTRHCQELLDKAEQQVKILTEISDDAEPDTFSPEEDA